MTVVEGLGTRVNFPDYIGRRPAMAMLAAKDLADFISHMMDEGRELPFPIPPFSVLMYLEMVSILKELAPEGVVFQLHVPNEVAKWIKE